MLIVKMTTTVVAVIKWKYSNTCKMSARFNTKIPTVLTNFSIAFSPQVSSYHVHWDTNAVQMVKITI
jgi:hypothetical protein